LAMAVRIEGAPEPATVPIDTHGTSSSGDSLGGVLSPGGQEPASGQSGDPERKSR
jgi:hypothetical protein